MRHQIDENTVDASRDKRDERDKREEPRPISLAPTSLARTMHTVPERPRPRAAGAIVVGLLVSAACAGTVLGLGRRAPSPYPPVTPSTMSNASRYTVSASRPVAPVATIETPPAPAATADAGAGRESPVP